MKSRPEELHHHDIVHLALEELRSNIPGWDGVRKLLMLAETPRGNIRQRRETAPNEMVECRSW